MIVVDNVADFAKYNEEDLRRYLTSGKGKSIYDPDMVNDIIQNFYYRIIRNDSLSKFDPKIASFKTYILTILCNMLPYERKRNPNARYSHVSVLSNSEGSTARCEDEADIFDFVHGPDDHNEFGIVRKNMPSCIYQREEDECAMHMMSFIEFIKESEPNREKAEKMICFVEHKMQGCLATDIAVMLGVSDNMVKIMKNNIYDKYKKWDNPKELSHA